MTEVLHSPACSSSSSPFSPTHNTGALFQTPSVVEEEEAAVSGFVGGGEGKERDKERDHLSLLALLVALLRKSFWVACKTDRDSKLCGMEIGWPTDVRHVAHVTFDRFNGFLGLPVELEPEVPRRAPSASATVFGVSTESMQLSYDSRGNSVPTILLLMQRHLYVQGGLQAEGIFRINAENSQEEYVREQLNRGVVPEGIDAHCLAGLIKAWFRELPTGVLDTLSHEQVLQCKSEEDCAALVRLLPPIEAALLDWAVNLMADVVQMEHLNKMNARNIAMVFAPNMTQMADPLTALMYAVQVMNFLKTLIEKALREREDSLLEQAPITHLEPSDDNGHQNPLLECRKDAAAVNEEVEQSFVAEEPHLESACDSDQVENASDEEYCSYGTSTEESDSGGSCETPKFPRVNNGTVGSNPNGSKIQVEEKILRNKLGQLGDESIEEPEKNGQQSVMQVLGSLEKNKSISNLSLVNTRMERFEAWW